jgi:PST family polysaccharide transporter
MRVLRAQLDMIIAGKLLSPELLGIYSFAKSAGIGLSQSLSAAYISVLYPYICKQQRNNPIGFKQAPIFLLSSAIALLFLLQAIIAPFYIQWLFSAHWHSSAALVSLLCLSAIPAIFIDTECNLLRAQSRIKHEFYVCSYCVMVSAIGLLLLQPSTPMEFAIAVAITSSLWLTSLLLKIIPFISTSFKKVQA